MMMSIEMTPGTHKKYAKKYFKLSSNENVDIKKDSQGRLKKPNLKKIVNNQKFKSYLAINNIMQEVKEETAEDNPMKSKRADRPVTPVNRHATHSSN